MIKLTVERFKEYLRVDYTEEDNLIEAMLNAAIDYVCNFCGIDNAQTGFDNESINEALKQAIYMLAANWFENREDYQERFASTNKTIPTAALRIMWLYRRMPI